MIKIRIVIFLLFLAFYQYGNAQMKVRNNNDKTLNIGVITIDGKEEARCETVGKAYYFTIAKQDYEINLLKTWGFAFLDNGNAFEDFYNLINSGFLKTPSNIVIVDFDFWGDNIDVGIEYLKTEHETKVRFSKPGLEYARHYSHWFTREQIKSLFGR